MKVWIVLKKCLEYEDEQFEVAYLDEKLANAFVALNVFTLKKGEHYTVENYPITSVGEILGKQ